MTAPALSVVIPAYNEQARIGASLDRALAWLDERGEDYELIVADDGSTDTTCALVEARAARHPRLKLLRLPHRGKGGAVRGGMLAAQGRLVLFSDADLATPIEELDKLRAALAAGADVAIGSRALAGSDIRVRQHPARELMGRTFNLIIRAIVMGGIKDTQCGFKLFTAEAARDLFSRATVDGFAFDVEVLMLAKGRWRVAEVPVVWRHVDESKVSPGKDAALMLRDVLKLRLSRWNHRRKGS
jgi:dolichyl-phosphate beta-glucosyltransferase